MYEAHEKATGKQYPTVLAVTTISYDQLKCIFFFKHHTTSLGVLQSMASWRVQHDLTTEQQQQPHPLDVESKKKWYKWAYLQNRKRFTDLEDEFMVAGGREGILIVREFGKVMYPLLYSKWIPSTRTYCIAQGTLLDGMWQLGWVGVWGQWIHTHVGLSPFTVHLKLSQDCYSATLQSK